jgi:hypothetical protein
VKIVRQVGRQMNGAVATVGMSKSYQTLLRRIGAMEQFRRLTGREIFVAASLLAIAAGLAIVPWRLVAQESKTPQSVIAAESPTQTEAPRQLSDLDQKLVGDWLGGFADGSVTFKPDGTFEESPRSLTRERDAEGAKGRRESSGGMNGSWKINSTDGKNQLALTMNTNGVGLRGLTVAEPSSQNTVNHFVIVLLDNSFLRLSAAGRPVAFYRRINTDSATSDKTTETFSESLPSDFVKLAKLAGLSADEAKGSWDVLNMRSGFSSTRWVPIEKIPFNLLLRIEEARRQRIDFAEFFEMSPEEATAFRDIYKLSGSSIGMVRQLDRKGQLRPIEHAAIEKVDSFGTRSSDAMKQVDDLTNEDQLNRLQNRPRLGGRGEPLVQLDSNQLAGCRKLDTYVKSLQTYTNSIYR